MTPEVLSMQIIAGGLLGTLGQGVRVIAGLKKAHDSASHQNQALTIDSSAMLTSLFIGFTAGALALLGTTNFTATFDIDKSTASALVAAGYAGTDFIEAFIKKYLPSDTPSNVRTEQAAHDEKSAASPEHPAVG